MPKDTAKNTMKDKLLSNAVRLFLKKGYERTSTRDIAKAVGIKAPGIYYYFKSKKAILEELNEESWQKFQEVILDLAKEVHEPEERIKLYIRNMIKYQLDLGEKTLLLDDSVTVKNVGSRKAYEREVFCFIKDSLAEIAIKKGIKNSVDPVIAAFSLFGMVTRIYRWYNPKGSISLEDLIEQIIQLFFKGFLGTEESA